MHDGRRNPITGYSVIIAEHRGDRPQEWAIQQASRADFECPFCEGREGCTPNESLARRPRGSKPNGPGWRVRVVPNKYPVLCPRRGIISPPTGLHEIIIESPRHLASITQLNEVDFAEVVGVYHERLATLRGSFKSAILFKNSGLLGGATLSHLHSQLITNAAMGPQAKNFENYPKMHGTCPLCEMIGVQVVEENLIVLQSERFLVFCPFASRFAYEMWIAPREHLPSFELILPENLAELAALFRAALVKLEATVKSSAYNYIIHTAPFDTSGTNHYHWHIEILPRLSNLAGFELGTGCFINTISPEHAAAALRVE